MKRWWLAEGFKETFANVFCLAACLACCGPSKLSYLGSLVRMWKIMKTTTECRMNIMKSVGMNLVYQLTIMCRLFAWFCCICFMDSLFFSGAIFDAHQISLENFHRFPLGISERLGEVGIFFFFWPMGTMEVDVGCWIVWGINFWCIHIIYICNITCIYNIYIY